MPGAYAHLTLVNIAKETAALDATEGMTSAASMALLVNFRYCELGALAPDYPYLNLGDHDSTRWADLIHYPLAGPVVQAAVARISGMSGPDRDRALAWLLGFVAHTVTDMTIHPVVERKVGPYAENKRDHRVCEMSQDVYIFGRLNVGVMEFAEHLDSGIAGCTGEDGALNQAIEALWRASMHDADPWEATKNPADPSKWHRRFKLLVDRVAEEGYRLPPLARHVATNLGLTYPETPDFTFIEKLETPTGATLGYDEIFNRAVANVRRYWGKVVAAVDKAGERLPFDGWNLDNGRDAAGRLVFWEDAL